MVHYTLVNRSESSVPNPGIIREVPYAIRQPPDALVCDDEHEGLVWKEASWVVSGREVRLFLPCSIKCSSGHSTSEHFLECTSACPQNSARATLCSLRSCLVLPFLRSPAAPTGCPLAGRFLSHGHAASALLRQLRVRRGSVYLPLRVLSCRRKFQLVADARPRSFERGISVDDGGMSVPRRGGGRGDGAFSMPTGVAQSNAAHASALLEGTLFANPSRRRFTGDKLHTEQRTCATRTGVFSAAQEAKRAHSAHGPSPLFNFPLLRHAPRRSHGNGLRWL